MERQKREPAAIPEKGTTAETVNTVVQSCTHTVSYGRVSHWFMYYWN